MISALFFLNINNKSVLISDFSIFIDMKTYGMVECIHQVFHHIWLDKFMNIYEWDRLDSQNMNIKNFNYHLSHLKLSFYRSLIFSGFQNKIIEAERRGNVTEVFNSIQKFKDDNLYKTQNINIEQIKNNCELVLKIFFLNYPFSKLPNHY